jgi:hypothetical protein
VKEEGHALLTAQSKYSFLGAYGSLCSNGTSMLKKKRFKNEVNVRFYLY